MNITIKINTDNAAFGETSSEAAQEVANILAGLTDILIGASMLVEGSIPLRDSNGNKVGQFTVKE